MKNISIDLIQIFCSNFKCDIDLRLAPGGPPRYISSVNWPLFEDFNKPQMNNDSHNLRTRYQKLEILLKNSRYSIETVQLVLSSPNKYPHLENAIKTYYSKNNIKDFFHSDAIVEALQILNLIEINDDSNSQLIEETDMKFLSWLHKAVKIIN